MESFESNVFVRTTDIGQGVFAAIDIEPDTVIGEIRGRWISDPGYYSDYCIDGGDDGSMEPTAPFRYLNHHCRPNCEIYQWDSHDKSEHGAFFLHAFRPISAGDELTIDYAWSAEVAIPCRCGSRFCRGWIVSIDELPLLRQLRRKQEQQMPLISAISGQETAPEDPSPAIETACLPRSAS